MFRGPSQTNDLNLSPVSVAFAAKAAMPHPYAMPSPQQAFDIRAVLRRLVLDRQR
ncbi:MAG: hypothetical protein IPK26_04570 [Planctomycetes bacterium]|nr:hypothetical protein [Planctomycetota bacterium]